MSQDDERVEMIVAGDDETASSSHEEDSLDEEMHGLSDSDAEEPTDSLDEDYDPEDDPDELKEEILRLKQENGYLLRALAEAQAQLHR